MTSAFASRSHTLVWLGMAILFAHVGAEGEAAVSNTAQVGKPELSDAEKEALRAEAQVLEDKAVEAVKKSDASSKQFLKTAQALSEKLQGMKASLAAAGENADPELAERVKNLEKDLKEMGLEYMQTVDEGSDKSRNPQDVKDFLSACLILSVQKLGTQRAATQKSLQKLEDEVPAAGLAKDELWRMVAECVTSFTAEEFKDFKAGLIKRLPDAYVEASKKPEAEQKLLEVDANVWKLLKGVAKGLLVEMKGDPQAPPPIGFGMLALIPVGLAVAFLFKLFRDMQMREEERKGKKDKKEAKKSK